MMNNLFVRLVTLLALAAWLNATNVNAQEKNGVPDFTQGGKIPQGAKHDWNLGPTGLRGWMYCDQLVTTDARQILITQVDAGSPAEKSFRVGDVILGVGGKPFSFDPRTELGQAITIAESKAGRGKLTLTRWRAGKSNEVVINLKVQGDYSATAPFDCEKSKRMLDQGCQALAARMLHQEYPNIDAIPRSLNALALLASGNRKYQPLLKREAEWAASYSDKSMQTWYYGYCMLFLSEYALATGDKSVLPGLNRLALEAAKGQSRVGSWGHGFAIPDGRLGGYGMMNSPGVVLTISLALAREAGVKDVAVDEAIERSAKLLRFYTGKGSIPYGDHHPWVEGHEDNGKCGMAAVLFNSLGETEHAEFFARMSVAAHGPERDCGHCGNYFNMFWAMPSVALSGPNATGAWMNEFGAWYFDLARNWDGSYPHQGPPENDHDSFNGFDATGTYLLAYAMPLKKIRLTGAGKSVVPNLETAAAESLIADGRGWDNKDRHSAYDKLTVDQLVERLRSWSPIVRDRAAMALARRSEVPVTAIVNLLDAPCLEARYGACQALSKLGQRSESAVGSLQKCLNHEDMWLRVSAADALSKIGPAAGPSVPKLLELLAQVDKESDPRGMQQRYVTFALFDHGGMLSGSLEGVDRDALYTAIRAALKNQDGRARGSLGSVYRNLSAQEIKPLLPAIYQAITEPAPSGEMFADEIRVEGLRLFAKHRIEEGIEACVRYTRQQNPWASEIRTPELMNILLSYGTHAKAVVPELRQIANYFENDEPDFPEDLMKQKANCVRETIQAIEASTETPQLMRLPKDERSPRTVNIINFIRQCEPRIDWITEDVLYETVVEQIKLMKRHRLRGTFLVQYDALIDPRYQELLKSLPSEQFEIGAWWEIPQPLVERSGYTWRGRYPWDWHADVGFATGYSPEEREKLTDTYMADFKAVFGKYPKSVGSWFIDAHTLQYMAENYGIEASCNCKDQVGTDGYTMWGGYWNQGYYPSKKNAYMPAQNAENQIPVPIFRMLGSDPIHQYDSGLGTDPQRVISLEPVYTAAGGDEAWCQWYFDAFVDGAAMDYAYTQVGQENSFTWKRMEKGFNIQLPLVARLQTEGKVEVKTLGETGKWFKERYGVTPPTAVTVLNDYSPKNQKTVWFNSRFFRANLLWDQDTVRFRDIHLFDETVASDYLTKRGTSSQCFFHALPMVDGFNWSTVQSVAGLRFKTAGRVEIKGGTPTVDDQTPGELTIRWPTVEPSGEIVMSFNETTVHLEAVGDLRNDWLLELTHADTADLPFRAIKPDRLSCDFKGTAYSVFALQGTFTNKPITNKSLNSFQVLPEDGKIVLNLSRSPVGRD
jgi:hypothetical protein